MADELNIPTHRWYQPRYNISLPNSDFSKQWIFNSGIQKIDAFIGGGSFSPSTLFALAEPGIWLDPSDVANLDWRRNLLLWSEDFTNAVWVKTGGATVAIVSGETKLVSANATSRQYLSFTLPTLTLNNNYTYSIKAKAGELQWLRLFTRNEANTSLSSWFDLSSGVVGTVGHTSASISPLGSGWYSISVTLSSGTADTTTALAFIELADGDNATVVTGNGTNGLFIDDAQFELGSAPSTYQPITDLNTEVIALFPNATMYQDRAGSTLVTTPGQFVGVRLDKSKGLTLGSEIVTNGDFATATDWTLASSTISAGRLDVNAASSLVVATGTSVAAATGTPVLVTFDVTSYTSGSIRAEYRGVVSSYASAVGSFRAIGVVSAGGAVQFRTSAAAVLSIDNVSIRALPGNHGFAPTDAARMTYGIEPKTGTRNILTFTEQYDNAIWLKGSTTVVANAAIAPTGTTTADLVYPATSGNTRSIRVAAFSPWTGTYAASVYAKASGIRYLVVLDTDASGAGVGFDLQDGTYTISGIAASDGTTASITPVGDGWYRCVYTSTNAYLYLNLSDTINGIAVTANGTDGILLWGAQLELGSTATDYQRVTTAFEVTEAGVPSCHYCQYDGSDDSMSTSAIDFTSTDAMSVFAGVFKRTDAALGNLLELSVDAVNTAGTFAMRAPNTTASAAYSYLSRGTALAQAATPTSFPAPRYNLVSGLSDISADQCVIRVNGVQATSSASDQGTGDYGNHQLFIGRRNNTNLPFAGRDYGIIVVGKALSAVDLASTETWLAAKTPGVTL